MLPRAARLLLLPLAALGVTAGAFAAGQAQTPAPPAQDADASLMQHQCVGCHDLSVITARGRTSKDWSDTVDRMVGYGVGASDQEVAQIKAYLSRTLPPADAKPAN